MARLAIPTRDDAPDAVRPLLDRVHDRYGVVPGVFRLVASNPAVLRGFAAFADGLDTVLDAKTRIRIAIAVSEVNGSDYCLSASRYMALNVARIGPEEIALNRRGTSSDRKAAAAVSFAARVAAERGRVSDGDIATVRAAGFSDPEIVGIVALVAQAMFTNLLNAVAGTEIDFPAVRSATLRGPHDLFDLTKTSSGDER